jgi:hypothetical protein
VIVDGCKHSEEHDASIFRVERTQKTTIYIFMIMRTPGLRLALVVGLAHVGRAVVVVKTPYEMRNHNNRMCGNVGRK